MARSTPSKTGSVLVAEVRYSLPEMLSEVQREREAPAFAMERLDQSDINRLFGKKSRRAVKPRK
jgi:hypothetical protein